MKVLLIYIFLGCFIIAYFRKCSRSEREAEDKLKFLETSEHIERLNELKTRIETVEQMITNIETCDPEQRATALNISMPGSSSSYSIIANSSNEKILELLCDERKKLRSSLQNELEKMSYRCNGNNNGNIHKISRRGAQK